MQAVHHQETIRVATRGRGPVDITAKIGEVVARSGAKTGICSIFIRHTSASLLIQENADPAVLRDLERWFAQQAPESARWEHDAEGPDDMPAHARAALLSTSEVIPVTNGKMGLGTWQAVYLWEHRARGHEREVVVHVAGAI
jgi:secondary thiamine-phosphate synthase enzyme